MKYLVSDLHPIHFKTRRFFFAEVLWRDGTSSVFRFATKAWRDDWVNETPVLGLRKAISAKRGRSRSSTFIVGTS